MSYSMLATDKSQRENEVWLLTSRKIIFFDATSLTYFFWHNRSLYFTFMLCSMLITTITITITITIFCKNFFLTREKLNW